MNILIRPVEISDTEAILEIYAPYITDTCISFETEVPSISDFQERVRRFSAEYPYLVCESDSMIVGYAYASRYAERKAYRYSADVSVYISKDFRGSGIGKLLYKELFSRLIERGIYTAYACITGVNERSIKFHTDLGFYEVGRFHNVGFKHGRWLDVVWLEKPLRDYDTPNELI